MASSPTPPEPTSTGTLAPTKGDSGPVGFKTDPHRDLLLLRLAKIETHLETIVKFLERLRLPAWLVK